MTEKSNNEYQKISAKNVLTPKGTVKSAIIKCIDEPEVSGDATFIPDGETMQVSPKTGYYIKSLNGWMKAIFYEEGSIAGPLVVSKMEEIESPAEAYISKYKNKADDSLISSIVFVAMQAILGAIILPTLFISDTPDHLGYLILSVFIVIAVFVLWRGYRKFSAVRKVSEYCDNRVIAMLRPLMAEKAEVKSWIPKDMEAAQ